jgi:hypothetical protein
VDNPVVSYASRSDATPEAEISALAAIYKLCLESHAQKRGRLLDKDGLEDEKERSRNDSLANASIPR